MHPGPYTLVFPSVPSSKKERGGERRQIERERGEQEKERERRKEEKEEQKKKRGPFSPFLFLSKNNQLQLPQATNGMFL